MTLTSADLVRQRVQDITQRADYTLYGDGTANSYGLQHTNIQSASAFVGIGSPPTAWSATGCTFDATGFVQFSATISANTAFNVRYVYNVWSDDVIGQYITAGGDVIGAALLCAYDLLFDNAKRSRWMGAQGAQYDNMQAGNFVKDMISALKEEQFEAASQGGQFNSWAETQQDY